MDSTRNYEGKVAKPILSRRMGPSLPRKRAVVSVVRQGPEKQKAVAEQESPLVISLCGCTMLA
ncbi:hypothetical protein Pla22_09060 [Rubripirellula amarantea]|uniref:Uncharacterized protein n=1 Tax=Rubripirellula amarantea TaxID=2527999 RepID=A0A5C5WRU9_9BACT|nr:hypothetical protein Pla22_09060 [Rubripirellula amarantea]